MQTQQNNYFEMIFHKKIITLTHVLGQGGEGGVLTIEGFPNLVAKIFLNNTHQSDKITSSTIQQSLTSSKMLHDLSSVDIGSKLMIMAKRPPKTLIASENGFSVTWPIDILRHYNSESQFASLSNTIGYAMYRVPPDYKRISFMMHPKARKSEFPQTSWKQVVRIALNLAQVLQELHNYRYIVGDLNYNNIMVNPKGRIVLIDTDSFQVRDFEISSVIYPCNVYFPECSPPELLKQSTLNTPYIRTIHADNFILAIIIFKLLMNNIHPCNGVWQDTTTEPPAIENHIINGDFGFLGKPYFTPPPAAMPFTIFSEELQTLFLRCFQTGHQNPAERPRASEYAVALRHFESALVQCRINPLHWHGPHIKECPLCKVNW